MDFFRRNLAFLILWPIANIAMAQSGSYVSDLKAIREILDSNGLYDRVEEEFAFIDEKSRRVIDLNLRILQLKRLPKSIGQLQALRSLDLSRNKLSKIPNEIGLLTNLTSLNLSRNQIITLPPQIGQLANLKTLLMSFNQLVELPSQLSGLTLLEQLTISKNQIETIPLSLTDLSPSIFVNHNRLCQLPALIEGWINDYSKDKKWNQLQRCPSGNLTSLPMGVNEDQLPNQRPKTKLSESDENAYITKPKTVTDTIWDSFLVPEDSTLVESLILTPIPPQGTPPPNNAPASNALNLSSENVTVEKAPDNTNTPSQALVTLPITQTEVIEKGLDTSFNLDNSLSDEPDFSTSLPKPVDTISKTTYNNMVSDTINITPVVSQIMDSTVLDSSTGGKIKETPPNALAFKSFNILQKEDSFFQESVTMEMVINGRSNTLYIFKHGRLARKFDQFQTIDLSWSPSPSKKGRYYLQATIDGVTLVSHLEI